MSNPTEDEGEWDVEMPDRRSRSGESRHPLVELILSLQPPNEKGQRHSKFMAGITSSNISSKLSELRKHGRLNNPDGLTMRDFTSRKRVEKNKITGEDEEGYRIWRDADIPIREIPDDGTGDGSETGNPLT